MLCSRCKKRQAVVFVTRMEGDKTYNDGLCLVCAKELGIKPVSDMMEKFGITDDDVEQMDEQLGELMNLSGGEEEGEEGFAPGGAATFPFLQNLFGNTVKYALEGTRVYVDLTVENGAAALVIKNISRDPLNIRPEELMERFVRGDQARHTEGSGLGLSIARSLMELQGGSMELAIDGDLFKVQLRMRAIGG